MELDYIYVNSLSFIRLKGGEIEYGVRQGCIMSIWLFNMYMDAVMEVRFLEEGRE